MKKVIVFLLSVGFLISATAQEKELKKAAKLVKSYKIGEAFKVLDPLKELVTGTDNEAYYYYLRGKNFIGKNNAKNYWKAHKEFYNVLDLELKSGNFEYSEKSRTYLNKISDNFSVQIAKALKNKDFNWAGKTYETIAKLNPDRRDAITRSFIIFQQENNENKQANYLEILIKKDKSDKIFIAKNKHTKNEDEFFTKKARDLAVQYKTHSNPSEADMPENTRVQYYNSLVRIYHNQGKNDKALKVLSAAKKEYPKNVKFFKDYATIIYKKEDKKGYVKAVNEVLALEPTNKDLWFNLAVVNQELKNTQEAIKAYDKVIELDPNFRGAYVNKGLIIMSEEKAIVDELNQNLTNKKKYDEIKSRLDAMYQKAIPPFKKAYELKKTNGIKGTLVNIYTTLGQKEKAAALK